MTTLVETNGQRLWSTLMEIGEIGATEKGGCNRIEFSDLNKKARDLFCGWAKAAGCELIIDKFGNIHARRPGTRPGAPVVMCGSHLDTQPTGGKFDGIYGVLGGLEAIRTLNDAGMETASPIEVVVWTNEEGFIFQPMMGSAVWTGMLPLDEALNMREDREGWTLHEGLERMGYVGNAPLMGSEPVACYLELHIEQGPVLETAGEVVGVVDSTQGQLWYDLELVGREAHAGPTPMALRRDAIMGFSRIALEVERIAKAHEPGCGTVGQVDVFPNSRNTIPGSVVFSGDLRHPDEGVLAAMDTEFRAAVKRIAEEAHLEHSLSLRTHIKGMAFNKPLADAIQEAAIATGKPWRRMYTGAGHDACNIARYLPTAMIFIPCRNGISHNETEWAEPEHVKTGTDVLATTLVTAANAQVNFGSRNT